jgi:catechol 2,3-dioxygenase
VLSFTLEVPELETGVKFYTHAGLTGASDGQTAHFRCEGQNRDCLALISGAPAKRLHHVRLRAEALDDIAAKVPDHKGSIVDAPVGFDSGGLWVRDPHGILIHLVEHPEDPPLSEVEPFTINEPGRIVRNRRSAILPQSSYAPVRPLKLGHVLLFSPDVPASVAFVTGALGMGLADHAQDIIAFCCARRNSDHHVLAFAKSPDIGFHHASFQVPDPDAVGRGGRALLVKAAKGDWGLGRHTIGSNFFHYIQDPWGSWFEYYSDMDYIDDYALWTPTNYGMEDSLASWGPPVPDDFVHNYEAGPVEAA